jgi:hypothetical protein
VDGIFLHSIGISIPKGRGKVLHPGLQTRQIRSLVEMDLKKREVLNLGIWVLVNLIN